MHQYSNACTPALIRTNGRNWYLTDTIEFGKMKNIAVAILLLFTKSLPAQELKCSVQVLFDKVEGIGGSDSRIYQSLKTSVFEFMNNTRWTNDVIKDEERIECSILINIEQRDPGDLFSFLASVQIQSRRPIYKTSYSSILLNHKDKDFQFRYQDGDPLIFSEGTFNNNITSLFAFYAYMILGYDYDSYALNGGTPYFQKAQSIVTNVPDGIIGWKAYEDKKIPDNRYWLIDNVLSPNFAPMREAIYKYHRLGLDVMVTNKENGRKAIMESYELLKKVAKNRPNSFNMQVFFNAKADEAINIFSQATPAEKEKVVELLSSINAINSNKYQKISSSN